PSLGSRTGLIDQGTGELWPGAATVAGLSARILPDERPAGSPAGQIRHDGVDPRAAGAVLTVAGHGHRRGRGRKGRVVQLLRHRGRAGALPPGDAGGAPAPGGRERGLVAWAAR